MHSLEFNWCETCTFELQINCQRPSKKETRGTFKNCFILDALLSSMVANDGGHDPCDTTPGFSRKSKPRPVVPYSPCDPGFVLDSGNGICYTVIPGVKLANSSLKLLSLKARPLKQCLIVSLFGCFLFIHK